VGGGEGTEERGRKKKVEEGRRGEGRQRRGIQGLVHTSHVRNLKIPWIHYVVD